MGLGRGHAATRRGSPNSRPLVGGGWRRNLPWHLGAFVAVDVAHACVFGLMTRLTGTGVGQLPLRRRSAS